MEKSEIEFISLKDLERINEEAKKFEIDLILIGGYAARAYTEPRSWRYTKDIDFIATKKDLTGLRGVFGVLEYDFEQKDYGVKGSKKINLESIDLHISVDKVIDWSTGLEYKLPEDIFEKAREMNVKASFEGLEIRIRVAPIEDVIIMKLMTGRRRDHFDAVAIILDSSKKLNLKRFAAICKQSGLTQHIKKRLETILADLKKGLTNELWKEFTEKELIRKQKVELKEKVNKLLQVIVS